MDETRILRQPTKPRVFRGHSFDDGAGIHIGARFKWLREFFVQRTGQCIELFAKHVVIVVVPGIARDPSTRPVLRCNFIRHSGGVGKRSVVIERADNDAPRTQHGMRRRLAPLVVQITHFPRVALREPLLEVREFWEFLSRRDAAQIESQGACDFDDQGGAFGARHAPILPQPGVEREQGGSISNTKVLPERDTPQ